MFIVHACRQIPRRSLVLRENRLFCLAKRGPQLAGQLQDLPNMHLSGWVGDL